MKANTIIIITFLLFSLVKHQAFGQSPQAISYQAVVRDAGGNIVTNQNVSIRFSILETSINGSMVYQELHLATTNSLGLVNMTIGTGIVTSGVFTNIDWGSNSHYLKTELDANGGSNFSVLGTQQMVSVPYALYAESAGTISNSNQHYVGEFFGGGVVVEVWNNGQNGLIMSLQDLYNGQSIEFGDSAVVGQAGANSDLFGSLNTNALVSTLGSNGGVPYAAMECSNYTGGGFGDWFLPSLDQLVAISRNFHIIQRVLETDGDPSTTPLNGIRYLSSTIVNVTPLSPVNVSLVGYFMSVKSGAQFSPEFVRISPEVLSTSLIYEGTHTGNVRACREF